MIATLLLLLGIGIAAVILFTVVMAVLGLVFGVVTSVLALAIKVLPLVLAGWVILKLVKRGDSRRGISASDRRWLDK